MKGFLDYLHLKMKKKKNELIQENAKFFGSLRAKHVLIII